MIHNIDCLKFLDTTPDESFDICITSPPYNIGLKYNKYIHKHPLVDFSVLLTEKVLLDTPPNDIDMITSNTTW